jgi:hypothetical protein
VREHGESFKLFMKVFLKVLLLVMISYSIVVSDGQNGQKKDTFPLQTTDSRLKSISVKQIM